MDLCSRAKVATCYARTMEKEGPIWKSLSQFRPIFINSWRPEASTNTDC